MKRFITHKTPVTEVALENPELEVWERRLRNQFSQNLSNTGRIEQLEAKQSDLEKSLKYILSCLQSLEWTRPKLLSHVPTISWRELTSEHDINLALEDYLSWWTPSINLKETVVFTGEQFVSPYHEKLSKIGKLFAEFEKDFDEIPRRIVRCELLEKGLADLEESLEDEETEYLGWCISLIRDVLDYNYAEELTETHLELLRKAIGLVANKSAHCDRADYQSLHEEFVQAGLALIPTTQKAIDKYGK